MFVDCKKSSPRELYDLLINAVVPRPIAWVATRSKDGIDNLAPFSFFNVFSANPPILGFSPGLKRVPGKGPVMKDTLKNVLDTEEFVVNIVSADLAKKMVETSADYSADISEFDAVGLTTAASARVRPPRVGEARVSMECKLFKVIELGTSNLVLGEVVCIHVADYILKDGIIDVEKLEPIGRLGGDLYAAVTNPFAIPRP